MEALSLGDALLSLPSESDGIVIFIPFKKQNYIKLEKRMSVVLVNEFSSTKIQFFSFSFCSLFILTISIEW
jgi:hypothetical protein